MDARLYRYIDMRHSHASPSISIYVCCTCVPAVLPSSDVLCFVQAQTDTMVLSAAFACTRDTVLAGINPSSCPASCKDFLDLVRSRFSIHPHACSLLVLLVASNLAAIRCHDHSTHGMAHIAETCIISPYLACACRFRRAAGTRWRQRAPRVPTSRSTSPSAA